MAEGEVVTMQKEALMEGIIVIWQKRPRNHFRVGAPLGIVVAMAFSGNRPDDPFVTLSIVQGEQY